ncbi:hypothetical protein WI80_04065 [Burkholderia ubonensis]|uniref:hypothetical protein n=1 Tax=Burkholderia ubonensis TaxID=101571 RepID=UPI00075F4BB7|nr:hypothetical protein [Burkholderia ubonensis]KVC72119.1 hypothetical protein WI75_03095 [Burkholderia ubonensis]KVD17646.1 hypothetical protein WI80_04065 [Burkholderia ubonensis]KVD33227.1 hypothetical protein WI84_21500 [Burkholderia ubonensis]KVU06597.1 hypothetical protein WK62_10835 [Burkholderia ubonensis]KVU23811.1 hypothetical protein WK63_28495 [Burkholderia ubonensis]
MIKNTLQYCATDKEIYDALMSAKQKVGEKVLLELAKDRGIFYSAKDSREDLISAISLLPHDYHDLNTLLEQREHSGRQEKLTSVTFPEVLTIEEIKEVLKEYTAESPPDERVTHHAKGADQVVATVKYSDVDYGKTRLIQRTPKEAGIEFHIENGKTVIRMPANDRIKGIFGKLKDKLDTKRKTEIQAIRIEIGEFESPALRTEFFTTLISDLKGFSLKNVTSVKVERLKQEPEEGELDLEDDQETEEAKQEALALVKKVALKGETLLASEEYQSLAKKGFFITSIIWRSMLAKPPYPMIEFEAAFEEPLLGKGFKYFVRGAYNMVDKQYTKTIRPVDSEDKENYLTIIEDTAANAINELRKKAQAEADEKGGQAKGVPA